MRSWLAVNHGPTGTGPVAASNFDIIGTTVISQWSQGNGSFASSHWCFAYERCSMGRHFRSSLPRYRPRGRMRRLLSSCSMTWADQPATRATTNSGV